MMGFIRGLISAIVTMAAIAFALANHDRVQLVWSPVNDPASVPLALVGLGGLGLGVLIGALMMWLQMLSYRFSLRRQDRKIRSLEKDLIGRKAPISLHDDIVQDASLPPVSLAPPSLEDPDVYKPL